MQAQHTNVVSLPLARACGNCVNFLRESDAPTFDGEPDASCSSEDGVCVSRVISTRAEDCCLSWYADEASPSGVGLALI